MGQKEEESMNRQELFGMIERMKPVNLSLYYPDGDSDVFGHRHHYPSY